MSPKDPTEPSREPNLFRRTLARHRWGLLGVWLVGTLAAGFLVFSLVKPSYKAINLIRADPATNNLYGIKTNDETFDLFLQTQVQLLTSPNVLIAAGTNPRVAILPRIQTSGDVVQELRKVVNVGVLPGTYLIEVSTTSADPLEAVAIVNAVVDAYMDTNEEWSNGMTRNQISTLETYSRDLQNQTDELERQWKELVAKGDIDARLLDDVKRQKEIKLEDQEQNNRASITIEQFKQLNDELFKIHLELVQAEAWVEAVKATAPKGAAPEVEKRELEKRVERRFLSDPEVVEISSSMMVAQNKVAVLEKQKVQQTDPALVAARARLAALKTEYNQLWETKSKAFRAVIETTSAVVDADDELREAEARVRMLKVKQTALKQASRALQLNHSRHAVDQVTIQLILDKRSSIKSMQETVLRRLEQLRYEAKGETRVRQVNPNGARVPGRPISDRRAMALGIVPLAMLFLSFGLFVGIEAWTGSKARPEKAEPA